MKKVILGLAMFAISAAANAVTVVLVVHNQTAGSGTISSLLTDGSHTTGAVGPSTAVWDWDGTTLSSVGLYAATGAIGSSPSGASILSDSITDLSITAGIATATAYACIEGNFLGGVGASGCGGHNFGTNFASDSTTVWGPGLAVSRTMGGDDVSTGGAPRDISAYNFSSTSFDGTTLTVGTGIAVGSQGGEAMVFTVVPVPAAVWLFGSALGLLGWARRRVAQ